MHRALCILLLPLWLGAQISPGAKNRDVEVVPLTNAQNRAAVPRGYALVIGISEYAMLHPSQYLQFAESDADAMYRVLISPEGGAFPPENVHLVKGNQATLANIVRELDDWLTAVAQPSDRVVVYFAGHGFVNEGRGYLAPWDIDPHRLADSGYPMDVLGDVLANRIKAHWKVLLTDACHSGKINAETTNEAVDSQFQHLPKSFLTITAATAREMSYEDKMLSTGFGLFTYFIVQALKGNADNDPCDGVITAHEVVEYVRSNVQRYAREHNLFQTPRDGGDYDPEMVLGVSQGCGDKPAPSMVGTLVVEVNMDDVQIYLDAALLGRVSKSSPLFIRGLASGLHVVEGVRDGYEPDRKEVMVVPNEETTVTLRIRYLQQIKKQARNLGREAEKLLLTHRSSLSPLNPLPVPRSQKEADLQKARTSLTAALKIDPGFSQAAFDLGEVNQLLGDEAASIRAYKQAIQIDPGYIDARLQCAAVLIESGDADEAIGQLTETVRLAPASDDAFALMARAYWDKGVWNRCIEVANKALDLRPSNDEAHLWKADALRQLAALIPLNELERWTPIYEEARAHYQAFLRLTNFSTPANEWIAFHFIGFHLGSRRHADRKASYNSQRTAGFLGLCLCDLRFGNLMRAKDYCERALKYDQQDAMAHFVTGNVYRDLFNNTARISDICAARAHYVETIRLNPDMDEANHARNYLEKIDTVLSDMGRKGCT